VTCDSNPSQPPPDLSVTHRLSSSLTTLPPVPASTPSRSA
jgi:hypothetical protein